MVLIVQLILSRILPCLPPVSSTLIYYANGRPASDGNSSPHEVSRPALHNVMLQSILNNLLEKRVFGQGFHKLKYIG